MNRIKMNKGIFVVLATVTFLSTVAPVSVSAEDASFITNVVFTEQNSGGKVRNGQDGQDGKDGTSGEDGKAGANGSSVINSNGSASVHIESIVNGVKVLDINEVRPSLYNIATSSEVYVSTSSELLVNKDLINTEDQTVPSEALRNLQGALLSLQLILAKYVSVLF